MTYRDGWNHFLYDTMTGVLAQQVDIPAFTWSVSVSDSSFATSKDKGVGADEMGGVELPWGQVPGVDAAARASALMPYKRGIVSFWHSAADDVNSPGTPILGGALGVRSSTRAGVSFPFVSIMGLLESRYLVQEGTFGTGQGHTSPHEYSWENLSYRALASEVVRQCTEVKPGGALPLDLPYLGEAGTHTLPDVGGDDPDKPEATEDKTTVKTTLPDGWKTVETDGVKTTVVEHREKIVQKTITWREPYTVTVWKKPAGSSKSVKVTETRYRDKSKVVNASKTVTETRTVIEEKTFVVERTVTTTTTVTSYDDDGNETGTTKKTTTPLVTVTPKTTTVTYRDFNVVNHSCADILRAIADTSGGPDMQFRPYVTEDGRRVRFRFLAGSDGDIYLHQDRVLSLSSAVDGGTLQDMSVDRAAPLERVYAVGAGTGSGTLCYLAQDLRLVSRTDGWPLLETTVSDSQVDDITTLQSRAHANLVANNHPLMQIKGRVNVLDHDASGLPLHPLGSFWPGEMFVLHITGFPDLPDGDYRVRLMQMSGDEGPMVDLIFDIMEDPVV